MKTTKIFPPTPQMQAVLGWAKNSRGNLNLIARAGCGKSSTLKLLATFLVENGMVDGPYDSIYLCSFNKPIADELQEWAREMGFPARKVDAGTMHKVGSSSWRQVAPKVKIDDGKVARIFNTMFPSAPDGQPEAPETKYREFVLKLVGFAKGRALGVLGAIEDRSLWFDMVEHFGLDETLADDTEQEADLGTGVEMAIRVYKRSLQTCREVIDFNDMILAPLYFKAKVRQHKWVLLDEAQDTNPARRALAMAMMSTWKGEGRLVAVGDPAQAIYGFTGADSDSMDLIQRALNSRTLPLNRTFRCGKNIVRLAQEWVPDILAADSNADGVVRTVYLTPGEDGEASFEDETLTADDAILCRNVKPLVAMAFDLLRRGIGCRIEGRDLASGIVALIRRFKTNNVQTLLSKVEKYQVKETQKFLAKGNEAKAAEINDNCETVYAVAAGCAGMDVEGLITRLEGMFGNSDKDSDLPKVLTLSTVHKSKGREWNRVYILGRNRYMPNRWAKKDWQIEQEDNLQYVAVTRAKKELVDIYVDEEPKNKERA